jgi:hypothetical protein
VIMPLGVEVSGSGKGVTRVNFMVMLHYFILWLSFFDRTVGRKPAGSSRQFFRSKRYKNLLDPIHTKILWIPKRIRKPFGSKIRDQRRSKEIKIRKPFG